MLLAITLGFSLVSNPKIVLTSDQVTGMTMPQAWDFCFVICRNSISTCLFSIGQHTVLGILSDSSTFLLSLLTAAHASFTQVTWVVGSRKILSLKSRLPVTECNENTLCVCLFIIRCFGPTSRDYTIMEFGLLCKWYCHSYGTFIQLLTFMRLSTCNRLEMFVIQKQGPTSGRGPGGSVWIVMWGMIEAQWGSSWTPDKVGMTQESQESLDCLGILWLSIVMAPTPFFVGHCNRGCFLPW